MEKERETVHDEYEIDMKGTIIKIFSTPEPEVSQEEAIKKYGIKIKKNNSEDDDGAFEDEDHLKRVKQELLASLKRVADLEKKVFNKSDKEEPEIKNIKYKGNEKSKTISEGELQASGVKKDIEQQEERE